MEFTPITEADFPTHRRRYEGGREFRDATEALEIGYGFSVPCIWKHNKSISCGGAQAAHQVMRRQVPRKYIHTSCVNGTLHILRVDKSRASYSRRHDGD
jgi:hypothetical protein